MPNYYFDTSAFLKIFIEEDGSDKVQALVEDLEGGELIILDLTILEARSAIRRLEREGNISAERARNVLRQIADDAANMYFVQQTATAMSEAERLLDRYALRTLDALHLAGCLVFRSEKLAEPTFVCADIRLLDAANQEGLDILNPLLPV